VASEARLTLEDLAFPLETVDASAARTMRTQALQHLEDYVLPRLDSDQAPLLAVIGGSTGAGKSTLINSLLRERVSLPGALRPTTRNPVLVYHPGDEEWFTGGRILPSFSRENAHQPPPQEGTPAGSNASQEMKELRLVPSNRVPQGLAFIDSPDIDSMVDSNRALAQQLLAAADLWIFLTTAARYADAVPWDALRTAAARQTELAVVIDRVDPGSLDVVPHLRSMLDRHELAEAPLFVIEEQPLRDGLLPAHATAHLSQWLAWLMLSPGSRDSVIAGTRHGAIESLARTIEQLAVHVETQIRARDTLSGAVRDAYDRAARNIAEETSNGSLLRGEVLSRWQDYVGTGEFMRGVEEKISAARDRVSAYFRGKTAAPKVQRAVGESLYVVIKDQTDRATEQAFRAWHSHVAGATYAKDASLAVSSESLKDNLSYEIRQWQAAVLTLVSENGAPKRARARLLAFGTNGLGVALMVVVFAATGGLTGAEIGIAGGTGVLAQRLLESVFGEDAVRRLAAEAQRDLTARIARVLDAEQERYLGNLRELDGLDVSSVRLRTAARSLHAANADPRHAGTNALEEPSAAVVLGEPIGDELAGIAQPVASSAWFGGDVDLLHAVDADREFYEGAVLYGSAGTRAGTPSPEADGATDPAESGRRSGWWRRILPRSRRGDRSEP
jgi:hypothetical protein